MYNIYKFIIFIEQLTRERCKNDDQRNLYRLIFLCGERRKYLFIRKPIVMRIISNCNAIVTMYGLKCGPAELQPFLKSPFSCTWNPCKPGFNPEIVPVTLTPSGCCSNVSIPRGPSTGEPSSSRAFISTTAFRPTACN